MNIDLYIYTHIVYIYIYMYSPPYKATNPAVLKHRI